MSFICIINVSIPHSKQSLGVDGDAASLKVTKMKKLLKTQNLLLLQSHVYPGILSAYNINNDVWHFEIYEQDPRVGQTASKGNDFATPPA